MPQQPGVGFPITRMQVDQAIGQLSRTIEQWAPQALALKAWLDTMPDDQLQAMPFNYPANDVALLKSAAGDLAQLARIYTNVEALSAAKDFGVFARRTIGLPLV